VQQQRAAARLRQSRLSGCKTTPPSATRPIPSSPWATPVVDDLVLFNENVLDWIDLPQPFRRADNRDHSRRSIVALTSFARSRLGFLSRAVANIRSPDVERLFLADCKPVMNTIISH